MEDLDKAAVLVVRLAKNHPLPDGNKRVAHAALEVFLMLNGHELLADVDSQEKLFLRLASGGVDRNDLVSWLRAHAVPLVSP